MKKTYITLLAMFLVLAVVGCSSSAQSPEKVRTDQCWAADPYTQTEKFAFTVDNIYVAEVVKKEKDIVKGVEIPQQKIRVKIIENIKGELPIDKEMFLYVNGGVTEDGKYEYDYGTESHLKSGDTYLFSGGVVSEKDAADVEPDEPSAAVGNAYVATAMELPKEYKDSEIYIKWVKAYENMIPMSEWDKYPDLEP